MTLDDLERARRHAMSKVYLGDGVYVAHDGYILWLTAENGIRATDTIALEPEVYNALLAYVARLHAPAEEGKG